MVFKLDKDAPKKYIDKWNEFKKICESGDNEDIVEEIKKYCKLETNKNLPYLKRAEGGMGGDNNCKNKQIRFRHILETEYIINNNDTYIVFNEIYSTDNEEWIFEELDDLIYAFTKTANIYMQESCVSGCIEMIPEQHYYSDDD